LRAFCHTSKASTVPPPRNSVVKIPNANNRCVSHISTVRNTARKIRPKLINTTANAPMTAMLAKPESSSRASTVNNSRRTCASSITSANKPRTRAAVLASEDGRLMGANA
jgi:hypothetical protein